jgi:hypothetical protein
MGSSVRGPGAGQPHLMHGVTAKAQVTEGAEEHKRATLVVAGGKRVRLVAAAEEANGRPAIAVRRAGALPRAAVVAEEGRGVAAVVDRAAVEDLKEAVAVEAAEQR